MRIVLIQPPIRDYYCTPIRTFPLGLCSLAASLEAAGHDVVIRDYLDGGRASHHVTDPAFDYLKPFYQRDHISPFGLFKEFHHYGLSFEQIADDVRKMDADVFGISSLFSAYADEALQVAAIIKKAHPACVIVVGGVHAHAYSEHILKHHPAIDYIVHGVGEKTLCDLLAALAQPETIPGITYRQGGQTFVTTPGNEADNFKFLPWPKRERVNLDTYVIGKKRYTSFITTRGCPQQCSFCSISDFSGHTVRVRDIKDVCDEIIDCYDRLGIRLFDIEDDNFTFDNVRAQSLLKQIIERRARRVFEITAMNGLYYEHLDETILQLLHRAGMRRLNVSLVTTSAPSAKNTQRALYLEAFENVVYAATNIGMHVTAYFIIGLPGESILEMLETLMYLTALPVLIGPSIYYHVPRSRLFGELEAAGKVSLDDYRYFRSSAMYYEAGDIDRTTLATLFRLTRLINFIKSLLMQKQLSVGMFDLSWLGDEIDTIESIIIAQSDDMFRSSRSLTSNEIGIILYKRFISERRLYSLVKESSHQYRFAAERASHPICEAFMDMAHAVHIRRSITP